MGAVANKSDRDGKDSLLQDSLRVLADIEQLPQVAAENAWCCFHFIARKDETMRYEEAEAWSIEAARPLFSALPFDLKVDYIGLSAGIEAWENVFPSREWLDDRLPRMWDIAQAAKLEFLGWTFEPRQMREIYQASP